MANSTKRKTSTTSQTRFMKKIFNPLYLPALAILAFGTLSCKDFLTVDPPGTVNQKDAFSTVENVQRILFQAYDNLQGGDLYGGRIVRTSALLGDEINMSFFGAGGEGAYTTRAFSTLSNNPSEPIWNRGYTAIYRANLVIDASRAGSYPATDAIKNQLIGEGLFIRALLHFDICRLYSKPYSDQANRANNPGAVLRLVAQSSTSIANDKQQRASVEATYAQVLTDLREAVRLLPNISAGGVRASKQAAIALKARVFFDMALYDSAKAETDKILGGSITLGSSPVAAFRNDGVKSDGGILFALANQANDDGAGDLRGNYFSLAGPQAVQYPLDPFGRGSDSTQSLVYAIRTGGPVRRDSVLISTSAIKKVTKKWRGINPAGIGQTNVPVLRLAEMYLTRAESALMGTVNEDLARADLNAIRVLAGAPALDGSITGPALLDSVRIERRRELFLENDRYHQLRRLRLNTGPSPDNRFVFDTDFTLPIPLSEINGNPGIQRNGNN